MLQTNDLSVLEEIAKSAGASLRFVQLTPGQPAAGVAAVKLGESMVIRQKLGRSVHVFGYSPLDSVVCCLALGKNGKPIRFQGHEVGLNEMLVWGPGEGVDLLCPAGSDLAKICISRERFLGMLQSLGMDHSAVPEGAGKIRLNASRASEIRRWLNVATTEVGRSSSRAEDSGRLVEAICEAMMEGAEPEPHPARLHVRLRRASMARQYIDLRLDEPLRLDEICRAAGVRIRTLQRCFKEFYGVTPTSYLTARRLNEARRSLIRASPEQTTVTETALDHGFEHLGRFSVTYRSMFGESPQQSLRSPPRMTAMGGAGASLMSAA